MRTLTDEKAAELVLFLGEEMSAAALYELAQEPFDPKHREFSSSSKRWRYGGKAADILSSVDPLITCKILAKFPEKEWAGAVLREMVISLPIWVTLLVPACLKPLLTPSAPLSPESFIHNAHTHTHVCMYIY